MENSFGSRKHDRIQATILSACHKLGINAIAEYRGLDWRADVYIPNGEKPIAFEIQLSHQSLNRTVERQAKYIRDGIAGCWLFESPVAKLNTERPDLPLFYVEDREEENGLFVNLADRRKLDLSTFIENFVSENIKFKQVAKTKRKQKVALVFCDMKCWKCKQLNHVYYVSTPFHSACNVTIKPAESMWEGKAVEFRPEIIGIAQKFANSRKDLNLHLATIKSRMSYTVGKPYTSFGCCKCDSIFGDWYVMEARIDVMYEPDNLTHQTEIEIGEDFFLPIPHWCFPANGQFCDHY